MKVTTKVEKFVEQLKKGAGASRALHIAENLMRSTAPANWGSLPTGEVFYTKDRKGTVGINQKELARLHNYWTHCYHVLRKSAKNVK